MNKELIEKARQADSPEEIMKIAEENDIYMVKEEAEMIYKQLHTSGEVADDELQSVAGGCTGKDGKTIVTSGCKCFNGNYYPKINSRLGVATAEAFWYDFSSDGCCGRCVHLEIKNGTGYCDGEKNYI